MPYHFVSAAHSIPRSALTLTYTLEVNSPTSSPLFSYSDGGDISHPAANCHHDRPIHSTDLPVHLVQSSCRRQRYRSSVPGARLRCSSGTCGGNFYSSEDISGKKMFKHFANVFHPIPGLSSGCGYHLCITDTVSGALQLCRKLCVLTIRVTRGYIVWYYGITDTISWKIVCTCIIN